MISGLVLVARYPNAPAPTLLTPLAHYYPSPQGVFRGYSKLLIGRIQDGSGVEVNVKAGDVIVLPAGTAHSSLKSSSDYSYLGVYLRVTETVS